jgi:hypothetical protein
VAPSAAPVAVNIRLVKDNIVTVIRDAIKAPTAEHPLKDKPRARAAQAVGHADRVGMDLLVKDKAVDRTPKAADGRAIRAMLKTVNNKENSARPNARNRAAPVHLIVHPSRLKASAEK